MGDADRARAALLLRAATVSDLPDLVRLTRAFYDEEGFVASDDDIRSRFGQFVAARDARIVVASSDGAPRAFALTTLRLILESGYVAETQDLYVDPGHRRNGVANALIEDAASWARARSASALEVVVAPNGRDIAHLFRYYTSRGFNDEGRRLLNRAL